MDRRFQAVVLGVGAVITAVPFLEAMMDVPRPELADELVAGGLGVLFLYSPYVLLAVLGRRARALVGYSALALLVVGSGVFLTVAASDAQGGLVAIYVIPAQWLVVALASTRASP